MGVIITFLIKFSRYYKNELFSLNLSLSNFRGKSKLTSIQRVSLICLEYIERKAFARNATWQEDVLASGGSATTPKPSILGRSRVYVSRG